MSGSRAGSFQVYPAANEDNNPWISFPVPDLTPWSLDQVCHTKFSIQDILTPSRSYFPWDPGILIARISSQQKLNLWHFFLASNSQIDANIWLCSAETESILTKLAPPWASKAGCCVLFWWFVFPFFFFVQGEYLEPFNGLKISCSWSFVCETEKASKIHKRIKRERRGWFTSWYRPPGRKSQMTCSFVPASKHPQMTGSPSLGTPRWQQGQCHQPGVPGLGSKKGICLVPAACGGSSKCAL